jgi:hypothetical protein
MVACPRCGLQLPERARFCARCGLRLPESARGRGGVASPAARLQPSVWLVLLFWVGCLLPLVLILAYLVSWIAPDPSLARTAGLTTDQFQLGSAVFTTFFVLLLLLQVVAASGLTSARKWGKVLATVVCALWMLTCVGIPVSIAALVAIWGRWAPLPAPSAG